MRSLSGRLALTYFLVVFLALAALDVLVLTATENFSLRQREVAAFTSTNIAVNLVEPYYRRGQPAQDTLGDLAQTVRTCALQVGARVLALDLSGRVVADSNRAESLVGRTLDLPEVTRALAGQAASGRRFLEGTGWVLYTAAPVLRDKVPVGAVLLSSDITDVYAALGDLARTMVGMSAAALALATLAGAAVARTITDPIRSLTRAVERMGRGDLGQRVSVRGRDEVATLASAFNDMARRLREEDDRRREFLADVAHELQTPVSALRALAEPLVRGGPGAAGTLDASTYKELAGEIDGQTERLGRLVADLLELARLESPRVSLQVERVDLAGLIEGVVRGLAGQARAAGVTVEVGPLAGLTVEGNGLRLEQVFLNLLTNAIKYSGAGNRVSVTLEPAGSWAVARISDTGPGISREDLPHVFERFYRAERSRSRAAGGTGLGLAVVKRVVELHGGSVEVESREGEGATFTVRLPLPPRRRPTTEERRDRS